MTLESTSNATKGFVNLQPNGGNVGVGTTTPSTNFEVAGASAVIKVSGSGNVGTRISSSNGSARSFDIFSDGNVLYLKNTTSSAGNFNVRNSSNNDFFSLNFAAPANSLVMDASGNIGIGTASPSYILDVAAASRVRDGIIVQKSGGNNLWITAQTTDLMTIGGRGASQPTSGAININTLDGSVGIGTATPARLLHVNGPIRIAPAALPGTPGAGDLAFDSGASNALKFYDGSAWQTVGTGTGSGDFMKNGSVAMTGNFNAGGNSILGNTTAAANLTLESTSNLSKGYVNIQPNGGNVGIGTATPGVPLDVNGSTRATSFYTGDGTTTAPSYSFNSESGTGFRWAGANKVAFVTGSADKMYFWNNSLYTGQVNNFTSGNNSRASFNTNGTTIDRNIADASPALVVQQVHASSTGDILQLKNSASTVMTVQQSGNVGIGTASPAYPLQISAANAGMMIAGTTTASMNISSNTSANNMPQIQFAKTHPTNGLPSSGDSLGELDFYSSNSSFAWVRAALMGAGFSSAPTDSSMPTYFYFYTTPSGSTTPVERMRIDSAGNVGIGTNNPARVLHVNGAARLTPTTAPSSPAAGDMFFDSAASNALKFYDGSAWQTVGTGTGSGDFMKNGSVAMTGNFNAGGNSILGNTTASANLTLESTSNATKGYINLQPNGGNVGIGTTTPSYLLQIVESGGTNALEHSAQRITRGTNGISLGFYVDGSGNATESRVRSYGSADFAIGTSTYSNALVVKEATGYIGIGTGSPTRLLQVNGAARLTPTTTPASPAAGDLFFDSAASNALKFYDGSAWQTVGTGTGSGDFMKNGSVAMTGNFNAGGNSILGNTTASANLTLESTSHATKGNVFINPNGGKIGVGTSSVGATDFAAFENSGGLNFVIDKNAAGSWVGIGNEPITTLHVSSSDNVWGGALFENTSSVSDPTYATLNNSRSVKTAGAGVGTAFLMQNASSARAEYGYFGAIIESNTAGSQNGSIAFYPAKNGTRTEAMRLTSSGQVGIGTTTPARLLHVNGPMRITPAALPGSPAAGDLAFDSSASNALKFYDGSAWQTVGTGTGSGDFMKNGSVAMTGNFNAGGNSILGNTTASANLTLESTSNATKGSVLIQPNGGNVAIGTTSPNAGFDFRGALSSAAVPVNMVTYDTASMAADVGGGLGFGGSYGAGVVATFSGVRGGKDNATTNDYAGYLSLMTRANGGNLTEKLRITSAGNVGIGTSAPAVNLSVVSSSDTTGIQIRRNSASTGSVAMMGFRNGTSDSATNSTQIASIRTNSPVSSDSALAFSVTGNTTLTEAMRIDTNGYVGIGTASPSSALDVRGVSGDVTSLGVMRFNSNNGTNDVGMKIGAIAGAGAIGYSFIQSMHTGVANDANLILNPSGSGNVGIGTTSPARLLHVNGAARFTPTTTPASAAAGDLFFDSAASNALKFYDGSAWQTVGTSASSGDFKKDGSVAMTGNFNAGGNKVLGNTTASANLTLESTSNATKGYVAIQPAGGNVGIGTTAPANLLDVRGANTTTSGIIGVGNSDNSYFMLLDGGATGYSPAINWVAGQDFRLGTVTNVAEAGWSEKMRISSGGNVGIGTTAPARLLHVNGAARFTATTTPASPVAGDMFFDSAASNILKYYDGSAWVSVGAGAGSGDFKKDGSVAMTGNFNTGGNSILGNTTASANLTLESTSNATKGSVNLQPNGGNVGIGTTSPANLLTIGASGGPTTQRQAIQLLESGVGTPSADNAFSDGDKFIMWKTVAGGVVKNAMGNDAYGVWLQSSGSASSHIAFWTGPTAGTAPTEKMRIDASGNVGIGTTNPGAALDVNGRSKFRSGMNAAVRVVTAAGAITVTTSDYIICVNKTTGAATTVNLPSSPSTGDLYIIKDCKGDASTNNITLTPAAGNIDGSANYVINVSRQSVGIFYDGTQWQLF